MDKANVARIHQLLRRHEEMLEEKRMRPEEFLRQNEPFREAFGKIVRSTIMPILEEVKDVLVGKVESASILHRRTSAGLVVKLDRWEDFDRSLLFFGDDASQSVRITHEGVGFALLSQKVGLHQIEPELVEDEAMKFLKRLFGHEQLRRPSAAPEGQGQSPRRVPSPNALRSDYELVRV